MKKKNEDEKNRNWKEIVHFKYGMTKFQNDFKYNQNFHICPDWKIIACQSRPKSPLFTNF